MFIDQQRKIHSNKNNENNNDDKRSYHDPLQDK